MTREFRCFGPPGTGKTTWLAKQIRHALDRHDPHDVVVCSFTRAAAVEIGGRETGLPESNVGTIHALAYHALGCPTIIETDKNLVQEWNERYPRWPVGGQRDVLDEAPPKGADALMVWNRDRSALRSLPTNEAFAANWEAFKAEHGALDFTDLLLEAPESIGARVLFVDEAQDLTPLQWRIARRWGEEAETFVVAGDDDQCQPGDTLIQTREGPKRIDALQPTDRLLAYDRHGSRVYGTQKGYRFRRAERLYSGPLYTVSAGGRSTRCTDNHLWLVKWTPEARRSDWHAVYLMRKGVDFRVGWAQMFRSDGCSHLNVRTNLEDADALWVLKAVDNPADAYVYESICAARYGLPTTTFKARDNSHLTDENTARIFAAVDSMKGAFLALEEHGLRPDRPLIDRRNENYSRFGSTVLKVSTCNLLPGLMQVPVYTGSEIPEWHTLSLDVEQVERIPVYSLDVEKYHTYVADGIVTHNCLYSFLGADPSSFLTPLPEENRRVLGRTWRLPRAVHATAEAWIRKLGNRRQAKEYDAREADGTVCELPWKLDDRSIPSLVNEIVDRAAEPPDPERPNRPAVMVLASCSFMLRPLLAELRSRGVPFHNPYRRRRGDWNPLRSTGRRILDFFECWRRLVEDNTYGMAEDWWHWVEMIRAELLPRGAKASLQRKAIQRMPMHEDDAVEFMTHELLDILETENAPALKECMTKRFQDAADYPLQILSANGPDALRQTPRIVVGTIHSVKGGEADTVYLFPDMSVEANRSLAVSPQGTREALIRLAYVGMTRAAKNLFLCRPSSKLYWNWN